MAGDAEDVRQDRMAYSVAIAGGVVLWLATAAISGSREAWDSTLYWSVTYPLSIGLAGVLGYFYTERPWRWGLAVMFAQALALLLAAGGFSLLPLGLVAFVILSLPAIALARVAAAIRGRQSGRDE